MIIIIINIIAASPEPRMPRSGEVKFHIGQVIRHKKWKYRGVIIGWDNKAKVSIKHWNNPTSEKFPHFWGKMITWYKSN